ncbi:PREDICTED: FNIP repeat-containing protein DDB_G0271996-like isoform X1 [Ceratosolen solmsi marchali]|uniref:FNIP repeat-containing protein DDB_G0271996-like isoform X1 n=1 Tax=Ceratosolen solmsi marchali TaxID=326594 RepID=A0AAJ6YD85_9HYME|nr:PREDICTED: FNIP repeat-containing protein DDB_G0271996-like isoform X1 [Ceratosolen solmsi marchali]
MSGSRLGRGRAGRLALLGCSALAVVFLMFLYRSTNSEMARLRDLHLKCTQQQEALATQLQVIYEYKLQLEKTLSNEKSANAAAKEELQKKASRERSLRDKDIIEAMQRFNSLQQNYKLLQTEHQDLKDDCKKKEAVALEDSKRLESTLQDLRIQLKKAGEDKEKSMEHLKIKYMELINQKEQLEENYNNLKKLNGDNNGNVEHLEKQVIQLQRELDDVKSPHFSIGVVKSENTQILPRHEISLDNIENKKSPDIENNEGQVMRPSSFLQVSPFSDILQVGQNPQPLQAPQSNRYLDGSNIINNTNLNNKGINMGYNNTISNIKNSNNSFKYDDLLPNEPKSDVRFENRNGNIVPAGPNDIRDQYAGLPMPYVQQQQELVPDKVNEVSQEKTEQLKQVLVPPNNAEKYLNAVQRKMKANTNLSSKEPVMVPIFKPQAAGQPNNIDNMYLNHFV